MPPTGRPAERRLAAVERALRVLDAFLQVRGDAGTTELARITGINPSTVSRTLSTLVDGAGRLITTGREDMAVVHAQHANIDAQQYLASLGWRRLITFQPADRFWTFQAIEMGIFVMLGALAIAAAVVLLRRRPA